MATFSWWSYVQPPELTFTSALHEWLPYHLGDKDHSPAISLRRSL